MWRFVQVSDPHLGSNRDGTWNNGFLCTMMPDVVRCLRKDLAALAPEFILATGDISSHSTIDGMFAARDLMDSLDVPYYPMGGNHDFPLAESREWFLEAFHARLPVRRTYYDFEWKNLRFCVLDPWWKWADGTLHEASEASVARDMDMNLDGTGWAVPPHQLEWLGECLAANTDTPTIVASHYPAIPIPDRLRRAHPQIKDGGCLDNGAELVDLLLKHPHVKAIFSGHVHMHFVEKIGNLTQVVTGAMPEYPTEYRDCQVHEDRIEIHTLGLSDPSFAARSLLPGRGWTSGQAQDRRVTIPLGRSV